MKTLYQAANAVEAHMLCDLLKREGIAAQIHGEALQGAIGALPAAGLVRLVVDDEDYARARELVERWDAAQPADEMRHKPPTTKSRVMGFLLLGIALGIGGTYAYVRTPIKVDGTDYNRDGLLDEAWTYSPRGTPVQLEIDRNLDRKPDYVARYDARGLIESAEADDDFNGVFETGLRYRFGNLELTETDTDGDLYRDMRTVYTHGVVSSIEFLSVSNGLPLRVEHYRLGKRVDAEVDSNGDGVLDTRVMYTPLGDVSGTAAIKK